MKQSNLNYVYVQSSGKVLHSLVDALHNGASRFVRNKLLGATLGVLDVLILLSLHSTNTYPHGIFGFNLARLFVFQCQLVSKLRVLNVSLQ